MFWPLTVNKAMLCYFMIWLDIDAASAGFLAHLTESVKGDIGIPIPFDTVVWGDNGHYDNTTGKYTVPYDGLYLIHVRVRTPEGAFQMGCVTRKVLMSWVVVITKEGWARGAVSIPLLVWQWHYRFFFWNLFWGILFSYFFFEKIGIIPKEGRAWPRRPGGHTENWRTFSRDASHLTR